MHKITKQFFKKMNDELEFILENNNNYSFPFDETFLEWKRSLLPNLQGTYKIKVQRINTLSYETFLILQTILRDMYWKYNNKENILLKAREENIDFELELSLMITGDDDSFPYRSSSKLTKFFENLGHDFIHTGETRKDWVKDKLAILNIIEIKELIGNGLLKKKYYNEYVKKVNQDNIKQIDVNVFYKKAIKEFEDFIQNSITSNQPFSIESLFVKKENIFDYNKLRDDLIEISLLETKNRNAISKESEDETNDRFRNALANRGYNITDQSRGGESSSGINAGERDLVICNNKGLDESIIEAFILNSLDSTVINKHYEKLVTRYDTVGNSVNFILVYSKTKNFDDLWQKYIEYNGFESFIDTKDEYSQKANVRVGISEYGKMKVYHLFINFYSHGGD